MRSCPSCGISVPENFDSCDNCGHSFVDEPEDDRPSVRRLHAVETVRWSLHRLVTTPALLALALVGGLASGAATVATGPVVGWLLSATAVVYPGAVAHRYAAAWVADEDGGVAEFTAAARRLPVLAVIYLCIAALAVVSAILFAIVFRPPLGLLVWFAFFVYLMLRLVLAGPSAVVGERGPFQALGEGWEASTGVKATLFGIVLLLVVAGLPFELLQESSVAVKLGSTAGSGLVTTLSSVAVARVYLQETL